MDITRERQLYRKLLDKAVQLTDVLECNNVTVEAVCSAIRKIMPETEIENLEGKVESIFEGVNEGRESFKRVFESKDREKELEKAVEEIFASQSPEQTKGFIISNLQLLYASENGENREMSGDMARKIFDCDIEEMKTQFVELFTNKAKAMGYDQLLEETNIDYCLDEENEEGPRFDERKHWYSEERAKIAAVARFMQMCEDGTDNDRTRYFASILEGAREEMCLTLNDATEKRGGDLKRLFEDAFVLLMLCLVILAASYGYFAVSWLLIEAYEAAGIVFASALGYLWPVYTALAVLFACEMKSERERIRNEKRYAVKTIGEFFESMEGESDNTPEINAGSKIAQRKIKEKDEDDTKHTVKA